MAVEEAASLVIQAASFADEGQIFILDMGEPIRTADLAEKMIRLRGLEPGRDIKIVYTGMRAGEKLHEDLTSPAEKLLSTHHPKISLVQNRPIVDASELINKVEELVENPPRSREELSARIHALARIDLRDTPHPQPSRGDAPAATDVGSPKETG
jgi:FlaA1/EpsC-like NDP-sugar epimerase